MGRPQTDERLCRWHPKHKLSTGVCPFCVREKLLQLTISPFSACSSSYSAHAVYSSTASSSPCSLGSDDVISSSASSPQRRRRHHFIDHVKRARASHLVKAEAAESAARLKKSRSLVFEIGSRNEFELKEAGKHKGKEKEKEKEKEKRGKKKGRFWSKLLLSASRRRDGEELVIGGGLKHSETFKEKTPTTWALFS